MYFDSKEALMRLLDRHFHKPYFVKKSKEVHNSTGSRMFSTPETGNWWNEAQVRMIC